MQQSETLTDPQISLWAHRCPTFHPHTRPLARPSVTEIEIDVCLCFLVRTCLNSSIIQAQWDGNTAPVPPYSSMTALSVNPTWNTPSNGNPHLSDSQLYLILKDFSLIVLLHSFLFTFLCLQRSPCNILSYKEQVRLTFYFFCIKIPQNTKALQHPASFWPRKIRLNSLLFRYFDIQLSLTSFCKGMCSY